MTLLHAQQLTIQIGGKRVCDQLDLEMQAGQVWGVMGRNGTGKTTLLHTLAGLRQADAGEIFLAQDNLQQLTRKQVAQKMGLLLQHHEDPFPATVLETVVTGRHPHISQWQWESREDYQLAQQALARVAMTDMQQRQVNQLSGGERQRVAIATLLTQDPSILLLDEPNSHLDLNYQINLLNYLCDYARQNQRLLIMTLHDINLAARYCDHLLLLLDNGEYMAGKREDILNETNLEKMLCHPVRQHCVDQQTIFIPV